MVALALSVFPSGASADPSRDHLSAFGSFTESAPQALAVDQQTGDLYVALPGAGNGEEVGRFDSEGNPVNFTCGGCSGNSLSGFSLGGPGQIEIAVDNSGGPNDGDAYVSAGGSNKVYVFSRSGAQLGTLSGSTTEEHSFGQACGVAVDQANGDLYVGGYGTGVFRFSSSGGTITDADLDGGVEPLPTATCQVAADHGRVYVADLEHGGPVVRLNASQFDGGNATDYIENGGTPITTSSGATALAVDPASGDLYVDEGDHIDVYSPYGAKLYSFGSAAEFESSAGIAVQAGGQAYVADPEAHQVDVYGGVPVGAAPPGAVTHAASAIGIDSATLNGSVSPHSTEITDCHFEYVDDAEFQANGFSGAATAACTPDPGESANPVAVHANVTGLATATTYHVRLVVESAGGTTVVEPATFTTLPIVFTDAATGVLHHTDATLHGHFDAHGDTITGCEFEWGTTTSYGNTTDCAEGESFSAPAEVSAFVNDLTPGEKIHFRLHLTTAGHGDAFGIDRTFTPQLSTFYELTGTGGSGGSGADQIYANGDEDRLAHGVAVDEESGDVYVADTGNHRVDRFDSEGNFISAWGWDVVAAGPDNQVGANDKQSVTVSNATGGSFQLSFEAAVGTGTVPAKSTTIKNVKVEAGEFGVGERVSGEALFNQTITSVGAGELTISSPTSNSFEKKVTVTATTSTGEIPFDATSTEVQAAIEGLPTVQSGDVQVSGSAGGPWTVEFTGARGHVNVPQFGIEANELTGTSLHATTQTLQQGGAFEVCSAAAGDTCQAGDAFGGDARTSGELVTPRYIAVDNSGGPSDGSVYVTDSGVRKAGGGGYANLSVTKFASSGGIVQAWGSGGQAYQVAGIPFRPGGLAINSAGNVVAVDVGNNPGRLLVFSGMSGALVEAISGFSRDEQGVAIDSGGTFLGLAEDSHESVRRFDPALPADVGSNYLYVTKRGAANDLAVDPSSGDLYTIAGEGFAGSGAPSQFRRYRFDAKGNVIQPDGSICEPRPSYSYTPAERVAEVEGCDETEAFGEGDLTNAQGIAINSAAQKFYTTDSGQLKIFTAFTVTPPSVTIEEPSGLTGTSVNFNAKVDPEGHEVTDCHFAYVGAAEFKASGYSNAEEVPCSPSPGSDSGDVPVSAEASGLVPATVYHFRIAAENDATAHSAVSSVDRTFTTRGSIVTNTHANPVRATEATLDAAINPQGDPTTYHFQYGPTASYGSTTPESTPIGSNSVRVVSQQISDLTPGKTYHFRIIAKNAFATIQGPDATFTTAGSTDSCSNAALRTGFGFDLPDCRAYEQASQVDKSGASAGTDTDITMVAEDGNGITYGAAAGVPTSGGGGQVVPVVAHRDASGWHSNGILSPRVPGAGSQLISGLDPNLVHSESVAQDGAFEIGDIAAGTWTSPFSGQAQFEASIPSYSADPEHFLFASRAALTSDGIEGKENLYEYDNGSPSLADRVPAFPETSCNDQDGPVCVAAPGGVVTGVVSTATVVGPKISADGSRIVFTENGSGRIYLREGGKTVEVNASQATNPDPNGHKPARLGAVSRDGSIIYFTSCEKLTDDSTAVSTSANSCTQTEAGHKIQGSDLYEYQTDTGQLTDLSVDSSDPLGAAVPGGGIVANPDGSRVYFAANGSLTSGAATGDCDQPEFTNFLEGSCELYLVSDGGAPVGVGKVHLEDLRAANIATDGTLIISSAKQLTSFDNSSSTCGIGSQGVPALGSCVEVYRYHPGDAGPTCVSCPSSSPTASAGTQGGLNAVSFIDGPSTPHPRRTISADGRRVFFETPEALVPADTNGDGGCAWSSTIGYPCVDVYEWEADGAGGCKSSSENGGCIYLISSGASNRPSYLAGSSVSGDDVFIDTIDRLVPQDEDDLYDVYDARVGGGIASQQQTSPPPCGSAEQCRGSGTSPSNAPGAGSAAFQGPGNSKPSTAKGCPKGKHSVRRDGKTRCVKPHRHKKKPRHHRSHRRANSNRGGSK